MQRSDREILKTIALRNYLTVSYSLLSALCSLLFQPCILPQVLKIWSEFSVYGYAGPPEDV